MCVIESTLKSPGTLFPTEQHRTIYTDITLQRPAPISTELLRLFLFHGDIVNNLDTDGRLSVLTRSSLVNAIFVKAQREVSVIQEVSDDCRAGVTLLKVCVELVVRAVVPEDVVLVRLVGELAVFQRSCEKFPAHALVSGRRDGVRAVYRSQKGQ